MTRFIHDRFAKEYLEELLSPAGIVDIGRDVTSEVREIDVYFTPNASVPEYIESLGLLGRLANSAAIFEAFRNPVSVSEVISCLSKLWDVHGKLERQSRRENTAFNESELPKLWILTESIQDTSPRIHPSRNKKPVSEKLAPRIYPWGQCFNLKSKI
ncbi:MULTISPECIES: hypothetical protein [unclassified Microcoleus]|uniref:hypothetical protein n=1 Tax=unclassified Microcoleus TaxID=2642155 RepID=UPI002FD2B15F